MGRLVGAHVDRLLLLLLLLEAGDRGERRGAALLAQLGRALENGARALVLDALHLGRRDLEEVVLGRRELLGLLDLGGVRLGHALGGLRRRGDGRLGGLACELEAALLGLVLLELGAELLNRLARLLRVRLLGAVAVGLVLGLLQAAELRDEELLVACAERRLEASGDGDGREAVDLGLRRLLLDHSLRLERREARLKLGAAPLGLGETGLGLLHLLGEAVGDADGVLVARIARLAVRVQLLLELHALGLVAANQGDNLLEARHVLAKSIDLLGLGLLGVSGRLHGIRDVLLDGEDGLLGLLQLLAHLLELVRELLLELLAEHLLVIHAGVRTLPLRLRKCSRLSSLSLGEGNGLGLGLALRREAGLALGERGSSLLLLDKLLLLKRLLRSGLGDTCITKGLRLDAGAADRLERPRRVVEWPRGRRCLRVSHALPN